MFNKLLKKECSELFLEGVVPVEVINPKSEYFGEVMMATRTTKVLNVEWYGLERQHHTDTKLWFKTEELYFGDVLV